ncbi:tudor domain-containing protein 15 isoform X2 [Ambystoma mexicanum]
MDSVVSLPKSLLEMDLEIFAIECHPTEVLVKFWGKYDTECDFDYHILQNEIQNVPKVKDTIGTGEFCLVEDNNSMEWHRGRVLDKKGEMYEVSLIDTGNILKVDAMHVASACGDIFQLPPKVVCGIFSNILPIDGQWSSKGIDYFSSLTGLHVKGHDHASLPSHCVLLEVPKVTDDVLKHGLAKYVDANTFNLVVQLLKEFPLGTFDKLVPDCLQQKHTQKELIETIPSFQHILDHLQPSVSVGTTEKVTITSAVSPGQFHCRIAHWIQELEHLTSTMCIHYEGITETVCENLGVLCAAKRKDGRWHRGVLQQLLPHEIKVWFMDFGHSEAVPSQYVHKLESKFRLLPMMSIPCALSCLTNQETNLINVQFLEFKRALLGETVLVHIDRFSKEERLYHVTLNNQNLPIPSTLQHETNSLTFVSANTHSQICDTEEQNKNGDTFPVVNVATQDTGRNCISKNKNCFNMLCPPMEMEVDSVHVVYVQYVLNPSNFWVRTKDQDTEYLIMMKQLEERYASCETCDLLLENPEPGIVCCARYSRDLNFYRAVVSEVHDLKVTVYFLDFGNTETVPYFDVKQLFAEFTEFPAVAMCCKLAHACPLEDLWIKNASDYFKSLVLGKPLLVHVLGKHNGKYVVDLCLHNTTEESNVVKLMEQAGYAEYWESSPDCSHVAMVDNSEELKLTEVKMSKKNTFTRMSKIVPEADNESKCLVKNRPSVTEEPVSTLSTWESIFSKSIPLQGNNDKLIHHYNQHVFKPGTVIEVICSHVCSPGEFWCQLPNKLGVLRSLMQDLQKHYKVNAEPFEAAQIACVAKRLVDQKWYRASILQHVSRTEVEVMFVDYGFQEKVQVDNLKRIVPDFLILEGQAFRCSLYNLIEPINADPFNWTKNAYTDFKGFLDSASTSTLKCTIYALSLVANNVLTNVVNLETPFLCAKQCLLDKGHAQPFQIAKPLPPHVSLCTFMYSSFNFKIGNEEEMYITHTYSPSEFYCQFLRNTATVDHLIKRAGQIATSMGSFEDGNLRLCVAKYCDGNFYRALACPKQSSSHIMVYFVDFGNKQMVEKHDVMPIPKDATDLLYTPMQALKCFLSDLTEAVFPLKVMKWFEKHCLGKLLKGVVVSKEMDGRLSVELYDGCFQINKQIKEMLKVHTNDCGERPEKTNIESVTKTKSDKQVSKRENVNSTKDASNHVSKGFKDLSFIVSEIKKETKHVDLLTVNKPLPVDREMSDCNVSSNKSQHSGDLETNLAKGVDVASTRTAFTCSKHEHGRVTSKKCCILPKPDIKPNSKRLGYASHINSPSSFFIQLFEDERVILQLAEELNSQLVSLFNFSEEEVCKTGDLVVAEYADDAALYRAVIKQVQSDELFDVEFIDYGNSLVVSRSKLYQLPSKFLTTPRLAIPAFLSEIKCMNSSVFCTDNAHYFSEKLPLNGELVHFEFVQEHEHQWEVKIYDEAHGEECQNGENDKLQQIPVDNSKQSLKKNASLHQGKSEFSEYSDVCENANMHLALEKQPNFCSIPTLTVPSGQLDKVTLCHVSKSGTFYVTLIGNAKERAQLLMLLDSAADLKGNSLPAENIKEGMACLTKSEKEQKWLRSEVEKIYSKESMLVFFVDRGTTEKVSMNNAKILNGKLKSIPKQAVACRWVWLEKNGKQFFLSVMNSLTCKELKILFLRYLEYFSAWEVEILIGDILLMEYSPSDACPIKKKESVSLERSHSTAALSPMNYVPWITRSSSKVYLGFASAATDPFNFFVQLEDSFETMTQLCLLLYDLPDNMSTLPIEQVIPGSHCLIKCDLNDQWCRSEISDISNNFVSLTLIDFGISLQISSLDIDTLKIIPEVVASVPRLAYPCILSEVLPVNLKKWSEQAIHFFQNFLNEKELQILFKNYKLGIKLEVDILNEQSNLADELVNAGHAVWISSCTKSVDNSTKLFNVTLLQKSVLNTSAVKGSINESNLSEYVKMNNPQHDNTYVHCLSATNRMPADLNTELRCEKRMKNFKEDGKRVNVQQQSNYEITPASINVSKLCALSELPTPSTSMNQTRKANQDMQQKDYSK